MARLVGLYQHKSRASTIIVTRIAGSPAGWPPISYAYLNSLPTDPTSLMQVIRHNIHTLPGPFSKAATGSQVFDSVAAPTTPSSPHGSWTTLARDSSRVS